MPLGIGLNNMRILLKRLSESHRLTNVPTKYELPTPYGFCDMAQTRQLHFLTNVPTKYELPTPNGFRDMAPTRFFKFKVITARSKVKSRSRYDKVQLHFLTNVLTKYELPTPYSV